MSLLFPRVAFAPVRCAPVFRSTEVSPLWNLFDETFSQLQQASRQSSRRPFNPRFNVKEDAETYLVEGELPGFDSKDISIEFLDEGHTLQIKGRTHSVTETDKPTQAETATTPATAETASETATIKSHQATVEDESEQPANASASTEESTAAESSTQAVAHAQPEQQVEAKQTPEVKHWVTERYTGSFARQFKFPAKVNQEAVKASLKDGILSIALPFAPKPESRRINIE